MTAEECVDTGGHQWTPGARGIVGDFAEHEQLCGRCPTARYGRKHLYRRGAVLVWGEPTPTSPRTYQG